MFFTFGRISLLFLSFSFLPLFADHKVNKHDVIVPLLRSQALSLPQVVDAALSRTPEARLLQAELQTLLAAQKYSTSWLSDNVRMAVKHQNDLLLQDQGLEEWELGLTLPLKRFGSQTATESVLRFEAQLLTHKKAALHLRLSGLVRESLWGLIISHNDYVLVNAAWQTAKQLQIDVKKRVDLGELAYRDLLLAQEESLARQGELFHALEKFKHAQYHYQSLTGLEQIPAEFQEPVNRLAQPLIQHVELLLLAAKKGRAEAQVLLERLVAKGKPELQFNLRQERFNRQGEAVQSVGLGLTMPLGGGTRAAQAEAQGQFLIAQSQRQLADKRRSLHQALHHAEHALDLSREALAVAQQRYDLLQKNVRLTTSAFQAGEVDLVELLRVKARAFSVERNLHLHQLQLQREISRLNQAAG
ncbi:MAG: TolC family protein, partial [Gammaproteobacteria bacterium]|nr:TolC family protein [Gammaproteobacteria bacterium]